MFTEESPRALPKDPPIAGAKTVLPARKPARGGPICAVRYATKTPAAKFFPILLAFPCKCDIIIIVRALWRFCSLKKFNILRQTFALKVDLVKPSILLFKLLIYRYLNIN
jgi:hypothetical protein